MRSVIYSVPSQAIFVFHSTDGITTTPGRFPAPFLALVEHFLHFCNRSAMSLAATAGQYFFGEQGGGLFCDHLDWITSCA